MGLPSLGVRVLTLTEFVVRGSSKNHNVKLGGLHRSAGLTPKPGNRRKRTDTPAAERLLKAFSDITLTSRKDRTQQNDTRSHTLVRCAERNSEKSGTGASLFINIWKLTKVSVN